MILEKYFNDYELRKIPHKLGPFDKKNIPLFDPKKVKINDKICYHPTVIIQFGLAKFNKWIIDNNQNDYDGFENCCNWLIENALYDSNKFLVWQINFDLNYLNISSPWISGLTQAQGISLLLRYYQNNKCKKIKIILTELTKIFKTDLEKGGVVSFLRNDKYFIQEASDIKILNGCLSALIGIYEYLLFFEDEKLKKIFMGNLSYLEENIHQFDLGFWSLYSTGLRFNISDNHYHSTHIKQLNYLGNLTNSDILIEYSIKWNGYKKNLISNFFKIMYRLSFLNILRLSSFLKINFIKYK